MDAKEKALRQAYQTVFDESSENVKLVLQDLAKFCQCFDTTIHSGELAEIAANEGRRQVWLRLQAMVKLDIGILDKMLIDQLQQLKTESEESFNL